LNATYLGQGRSQVVVEVTFSEKPQLCYKVGTKWEGDRVLNALVEKLLDENDSPPHNYSREQLAALLDRKVEERKSRQFCCSGGLAGHSG
jgi:hypothetical protein